MTISVVIPAYNEERYIGECIESILEHAPEELVEIIVVCNACTDRTAEVAARYPRTNVVHEMRKGTGYARQKGFEEARGDVLAYLDADSRVHARWFPVLRKTFRDHPGSIALTGPAFYHDLPSWQGRAINVLWWNSLAYPLAYCRFNILIGGNFAVRRSALQSIGGFDTTIPFFGDDTNLACRLGQVGRIRFVPSFFNYSSARRLQQEGLLRTGAAYAMNYVSQTVSGRSVISRYGERPWERVTPSRRRILSPSAWSAYAKSTYRKMADRMTETRT